MGKIKLFTLAFAVVLALNSYCWELAKAPIMTRWAKDVSPEKALPEYPRPQMVRQDWLNLNGLWDYAIVAKAAAKTSELGWTNPCSFPVESAHSV
jgi:hypothetical protein